MDANAVRFIGIIFLVLLALAVAAMVRSSRRRNGALGPILLGLAIGGGIGFLMRPSTLVGQLPFATVISRGAGLQGLDLLLRPTAEMSFNYMLAGAILGAVAGIAWNSFSKKGAAPISTGQN